MSSLSAFVKAPDMAAKLEALSRSQAVIEFETDGTIITANQNFLNAMGYTLGEIKGRHHRMFVDPAEANSPEYRMFWDRLARGEFQTAEFKRFGKGGKEIWIQATYNPVTNGSSRPYKIVKFATEITQRKLVNADYEGQLAAINRSQAVIQFNLDGTIITANQNFLDAMGYSLDEVKGRHHRMFVDPAYAASREYDEFWRTLNSGKFHSGEFKRVARGGRGIWIQASYNPILDMNGKLVKVVKYATDITAEVHRRMKLEQAKTMIEQNLDQINGAIADANSQSTSAANASASTTANVQAMAAGAEELNASVQEIANTMSRSRAAADQASQLAAATEGSTQRLTEAAKAMTGIVDLIKSIAGQINLLALNATIESARAGEAGKGFAVVANEVKNLAGQASKATEQIATEIQSLQVATGNVVDSLSTIKSSIETVREFVMATASAVEEQSAVTREMSANMQNAATAVESIGTSLGQIATATTDAEQSTKRVREASLAMAA